VLADNTYADNMWGMPLFTGGTAVFYNTDFYTEGGATAPSTSMDMLIENAKKTFKVDANGATTRSGWSLRLSGQGSGVAEKFWILLMQYGKTLIRETPEGSGKWVAEYNGPEGVKLFQMYVDFLKEGVDSQNIEHDAAAFEKKVTAQFLRESWVIPEIATTAPDLVGHYATVAPPVGDILTTEAMFVPVAAPHPDCSWEFIRFMREVPQQINLVKVSGWLPARQDLGADLDASSPRTRLRGFLKNRTTSRSRPPRRSRVRRDRDQAGDASRRRYATSRTWPASPTRSRPARRLGRGDEPDPQGQRPLRRLTPEGAGVAGSGRDARATTSMDTRKVDG
jgi:maltose-binding protein MalE